MLRRPRSPGLVPTAELTSRKGVGSTLPPRTMRTTPACSRTYQSSERGAGAAKTPVENVVDVRGERDSAGIVGAPSGQNAASAAASAPPSTAASGVASTVVLPSDDAPSA